MYHHGAKKLNIRVASQVAGRGILKLASNHPKRQRLATDDRVAGNFAMSGGVYAIAVTSSRTRFLPLFFFSACS